MLFWIQIKMTQFYRGSVDAQAGLRIFFRSNMTKQIFSKQGAFDNVSFRYHTVCTKRNANITIIFNNLRTFKDEHFKLTGDLDWHAPYQ